ncbi:MAG: MFS transporter [Archangiaceae bacterium]|nr:MFS transporter [Archangiaceae bacterium]
MTAAAARGAPPLGTLALLSTLYVVQGLPYGFQDTALPAFLSKLGLSYSQIGFASALSLPWLLKPLWAPFIDRYWHAGFGRRKTWIVPLQLLLACACVAAAFAEPDVALARLLGIVLVMNALTATQDIAVDGYAVDRLRHSDLGYGNSAQVVGYKVGMLVGGGLLWAWYAELHWRGIFGVMAGCCLFGMGVLLSQTERPVEADTPEKLSWRQLLERVRTVMKVPGTGALVVFVLTYKLGETLANKMFVPWLGRHFEPQVVAALMGTWVMAASLGGSLFGGLLASRLPLLRAVVVTAAMRVLGLVAQWALVAGLLPLDKPVVVAVASVEHFFSGALTVCMFALMMSRVDKRIGATHYTVLAAIEVAGKAVPGLLSGVLADAIGVPHTFLIAVALSLVFFALVGPVRQSRA